MSAHILWIDAKNIVGVVLKFTAEVWLFAVWRYEQEVFGAQV